MFYPSLSLSDTAFSNKKGSAEVAIFMSFHSLKTSKCETNNSLFSLPFMVPISSPDYDVTSLLLLSGKRLVYTVDLCHLDS